VEDAVEGTIILAESEAFGVFNIGTGRRTSINDLARMLLEILGRKMRPAYADPRPGDLRHSLADISKARSFGYNPKCDLREGLSRTISWFLGHN